MGRLALLLCALLGAAPARADEVAPIQRAVDELRYDEARGLLESALSRGHHGRDELLALYRLRGQVAAILDGAEAGEREFRRLLVLDPAHRAPAPPTPVWNRPFESARRFVAASGPLRVTARVAPPAAGQPISVEVQVAADPLAMVSGARLHHRLRGQPRFAALAGRALSSTLPAAPAGATVEYWVEVLDRADDVLATDGGPDRPLAVDIPAPPSEKPQLVLVPTAPPPTAEIVAPPPRRAHRYRPAAIATGVLAGLFLGGGIGFDVAAGGEFDSLKTSCAPSCTSDQLGTLHAEENAAIALYTVAGAAVVATVVLAILDWRN